MFELGVALLGDMVLQPINPKDEPMSDNHLNAQQIQRIQQDASAALQTAIDRMQLRKWAIEQAFAAVGSTGNPMQVARDIYDFVSEAIVVKMDVGNDGGSLLSKLMASIPVCLALTYGLLNAMLASMQGRVRSSRIRPASAGDDFSTVLRASPTSSNWATMEGVLRRLYLP